MTRRINQEGLTLIKRFEGLKTKAYICPAGVLTIGYGSTGPHVKPGMVISEAEAERLLIKDLARFEAAVERLVKVPLTDGQFAALVSFAFNVGEGAWAKSTLLKKLNAGKYDAVPSELNKWVNGGGKRLQGLVNRRAAEGGLWARGSFVASNTVEAAPAKPPILTIDNVVKVGTPAAAVLQSFTAGPAQIVLAIAFAIGGLFLLWRWHQGRVEAAS